MELEGEAKFEGKVARVRYQSEDQRFQVVVVVDDRGRQMTVKASDAGLRAGDDVLVIGRYERWKSGELQISARRIERRLPMSADGLERYLASGRFPGIGRVKAEAIVARFGERTFQVLDQYPERLCDVEGIGKKTADRLHTQWKALREEHAMQIHLRGLELSESEIRRILKRYGQQALAVLKDNPYRLAQDVHGIGFKTADAIAARLGVEPDDVRRVKAACVHSLFEASRGGHTCLPLERVVAQVEEWTGATDVDAALSELIAERRVVRVDEWLGPWLYSRPVFELERDVAHALKARGEPRKHAWSEADVAAVAARSNLSLDEAQRAALSLLSGVGLGVLTGGPGTGKTTIVRLLVELAQRRGLRYGLAAPTGRAAQRLQESTNSTATTLHRLLEYKPQGGFERHSSNPLELDLLIIDESSMIDLNLMRRVLDALPIEASLILVGDSEQLPSVGAGEVLQDVVRSELFPVASLKRIFRQSTGSSIAAAAADVLAGRLPTPDEDPSGDFFLIRSAEPELILSTLEHIVAERIPKAFGLDPRTEVQVLVPMRGGQVGTLALNERLQAVLNPDAGGARHVGPFQLREGDKVMQVRNNYDLETFNGDVGVVRTIAPVDEAAEVEFGDRMVSYDAKVIDDLEPAWAMTVHKSQGSEFPAVVVALSNAHFILLQRRLLYTAMTRAKRLLVIIAQDSALKMAVDNAQGELRFGHLAARIREA